MKSEFKMAHLQHMCLLGRGKFSWINDLMIAGDKHEPLAYIVFFISLCAFIYVIVYFGLEWRQLKNSKATFDKFATLTVQALLGISMASVFLFPLASRLFG